MEGLVTLATARRWAGEPRGRDGCLIGRLGRQYAVEREATAIARRAVEARYEMLAWCRMVCAIGCRLTMASHLLQVETAAAEHTQARDLDRERRWPHDPPGRRAARGRQLGAGKLGSTWIPEASARSSTQSRRVPGAGHESGIARDDWR